MLKREIVPDLLFRQLPERRLWPRIRRAYTPSIQVFRRRHRNNSDFNRLLRHLPFKPFFQGQQSGVYGVFQTYVIVVSVKSQDSLERFCEKRERDQNANRFSKNVFAFTMFFPIALAFQAQYDPDGST